MAINEITCVDVAKNIAPYLIFNQDIQRPVLEEPTMEQFQANFKAQKADFEKEHASLTDKVRADLDMKITKKYLDKHGNDTISLDLILGLLFGIGKKVTYLMGKATLMDQESELKTNFRLSHDYYEAQKDHEEKITVYLASHSLTIQQERDAFDVLAHTGKRLKRYFSYHEKEIDKLHLNKTTFERYLGYGFNEGILFLEKVYGAKDFIVPEFIPSARKWLTQELYKQPTDQEINLFDTVKIKLHPDQTIELTGWLSGAYKFF